MPIRITGAAELARVGAELRAVTDSRVIVNEMAREIRRTAGPAIKSDVQAAALAKLPKRNGLNVWVANSRIRLLIRRGVNTAGVSVRVGKPGHDLRDLDGGVVRHPLRGNRKYWYDQAVTPGVISNAITESGADVLEAAVLRWR
jgi:hypothetical protein